MFINKLGKTKNKLLKKLSDLVIGLIQRHCKKGKAHLVRI